MNGPSVAVALDLEAEHPVKRPKVRDFNVLAEPSYEIIYKLLSAGCDRAVINVYRDDGEHAVYYVDLEEDGLIDCTTKKTKSSEDSNQELVPAMASLLEAIERLQEAQHTFGGCRVFVTRWVPHVQYLSLVQHSIEISSLDVDLMQQQSEAICHRYDDPGGC